MTSLCHLSNGCLRSMTNLVVQACGVFLEETQWPEGRLLAFNLYTRKQEHVSSKIIRYTLQPLYD